MDKLIVYKDTDNYLKIMSIIDGSNIEKHIPSNSEYVEINSSDLPDPKYRDLWELDLQNNKVIISNLDEKVLNFKSKVKSELILKIKEEAESRITSKYSDINQRNIDRASRVYFDDPDKFQEVYNMHTFIQSIRDKSNKIEDTISNYTLEQLESFDPSEDSHWS